MKDLLNICRIPIYENLYHVELLFHYVYSWVNCYVNMFLYNDGDSTTYSERHYYIESANFSNRGSITFDNNHEPLELIKKFI